MHSQRHTDRQDIHAVGGVVGDLGDGFADDGGKIGFIRVEAQLGASPLVGHNCAIIAPISALIQTACRSISGGQTACP